MNISQEKSGPWISFGVISKNCGQSVESCLFFKEFDIESHDSEIIDQLRLEKRDDIFYIKFENDSGSSISWISGKIEGELLSVRYSTEIQDGEFGMAGGTVTLRFFGTLTDDDRTVTGNGEWLWEGRNSESCSGTVQVKAALLN